jgi:hypothetical protein
MKPAVLLVGMALLTTSAAWADTQHYGTMRLTPATVHVICNNIDDNIFIVGTCDNTSDQRPLHLEEDCELEAVSQGGSRTEWEGHDILAVNHPVPSQFVAAQTLTLENEDGRPNLTARFLVHISANADGSFTASMNILTLQCQR